MANRNECFSNFFKQKTAKERWRSLVSRMGDREEYLETPLPLPPSLFGRTYGRSYADVITKFSRLDGLPIFLTHGALLARFARWSSAKNGPLKNAMIQYIWLLRIFNIHSFFQTNFKSTISSVMSIVSKLQQLALKLAEFILGTNYPSEINTARRRIMEQNSSRPEADLSVHR